MKGNQTPRIRIEPKRSGTDGEGAALLMEAYGCILDEWQRLVLDCWLGKDRNDKYNVTSAGLSVPRQNGKNEIIVARSLYGLVINGEKILHTAHQVRTTKKAFNRLVNIFSDEKHPEIIDAVKQIHYAKGEERIELKNGGSIEFTSRSKRAARGYDGISLVIYDEAQELEDEQADALMATLSASTTGTRQILYVGTPPYVGCSGEIFRRFRSACIEDQAGILPNAWHEWSVPLPENIEDFDINQKSLWYESNPALGYRLTEEFTEQEAAILSKGGFCRERLGIWFKTVAETSEEKAIDPEKWKECASIEKKTEGKTAYGIKFSSDGQEVVLCGAVIDKQTKQARISLISREPAGLGLQWLADWLNDRYKKASCVYIDGRNGVDILIDRIRPIWIFKDSVIKCSSNDAINAASLLTTELNEGTLTWYEPQEMLNDSALSATKRRIGIGWGFGGSDSAPIEAAALALYGARTSKRDPTRKMRLG